MLPFVLLRESPNNRRSLSLCQGWLAVQQKMEPSTLAILATGAARNHRFPVRSINFPIAPTNIPGWRIQVPGADCRNSRSNRDT
jgi:hypothetical protein